MFYGLARGTNEKGEDAQFIIRNLFSRNRKAAEKEARFIARSNGYRFEGIHLAANHRQKQGEIKMNYTLPRERAKALAAWRG